jgi:hypothetical protein
MDARQLVCETLVKQLREKAERLEKLMAVPAQLARVAEGMAADVVAEAAGALGALENAISGMAALDIGLDEFKNAIAAMLDCPYFSGPPLGSKLAEAYDLLNDGQGLPDELMGALIGAIQDRLGGRSPADVLGSTVLGTFSKINGMYQDAVSRSGIPDAVRAVRELERCVSRQCAGFAPLPKSSGDILASAGVAFDEASGKVSAAIDRAADLPADVKEGLGDVAARVGQCADSLKNISLQVT